MEKIKRHAEKWGTMVLLAVQIFAFVWYAARLDLRVCNLETWKTNSDPVIISETITKTEVANLTEVLKSLSCQLQKIDDRVWAHINRSSSSYVDGR